LADNYLQFSEMIENLTPEEKVWLENIPDRGDYEDNPKYDDGEAWLKAFGAALVDYGLDVASIEDTLDMFPYFEYSTDDDDFWVYTEESADPAHVACVVQAFIKKFRPDMVFTLTWAEACSKPRVGEFGGGAVLVSAQHIQFWDTWSQLSVMSAEK
jgi:hypothetical protein